MTALPQAYAESDGWSRWITPTPNRYKMCCCDCGLVHNVDFRIIDDGDGDQVQFRVSRNNRSTAQVRRHMK